MRREPTSIGPGQTGSDGRITAGTFMLDRRLFLQLASAAGLAVVGSGLRFDLTAAQDPSPGEPGAADPVGALAAALGNDPERIFRFVQDEVRYEPYAGLLRGATGTLLTRAGNSVDQAVLLASLLRQSGLPVRFVSGALDEAAVEALMASTVTDVESARALVDQAIVSDADIAAGIKLVTADGPVPPDQIATLPTLADVVSSLAADGAGYAEIAAGQLQRAIDTIMPALTTAGVVLPGQVTGLPTHEQSGHTWVQLSDGAAWRDLDPSAPAGVATITGDAPLDQLPDDLRHRIDFTVVVETFVGGVLTQAPILEVSRFADDLVGVGSLYTHVPAKELGDINLVGAIGAGTLYNAMLMIGPDVYLGVTPLSIGGSGGDPLSGALTGGGGGIVEGEAAAEWLEVRVTSPGAAPVVARRAIFDRIGQVTRDSGVVDPYAIWPAELEDVGGSDYDYAPCRAMRAFAIHSGPVNVKSLIQDVALSALGQASLMAGGFATLRDVHGLELAAAQGCRPFDDVPNVVSWVFEASNDGARVVYTMGPDIWHRSTGTLGLTGLDPTAPPALTAGVLAHVIERIAVGEVSAEVAGAPTIVPSVGALFDQASLEGIPPRLLQGSLPADVTYEPEHRLSIQRALDSGLIVILPERAVTVAGRPRLGWWLVDPATGATSDEREDGAGSITEPTLVTSTVVLVKNALAVGVPLMNLGMQRYGRDPRAMKLFCDLWADILRLQGSIPLRPPLP